MKVEQLLQLLPQKEFGFLTAETAVDHQVKKLKGTIVFKLLLFSMLNSSKLSLRVMETFFQSAQFKKFASTDKINTKFNSIRDRISTINSDYFEKIFNILFTKYNKELEEENAVTRVDSTFINISAKLVQWGMTNGSTYSGLKYLKLSLSMKGSLPCSVQIYNHQDFVNENIALPDAILKNKHLNESIVVFDRGLQTRKAFDKFSNKDILFIGRIKTDVKYDIVKKYKLPKVSKDSSVEVLEDLEVYLYGDSKPTTNTFRITKFKIKDSKEMLFLVSNVWDSTAYDIAALYKKRWDIEVFFKFLKQHLNLKHIVSRNENAIKVMVYMTLIVAVLLIIYKKTNDIKGFKIAKLKMEIELDNLMIKEIVKLCGGNPNKAKHLWDTG
jgi:hypothetical protein